VDKLESTLKVKQADSFYQQGRFQDALALLLQIDQAYPNEKNVLYAAALCFEQLGRSLEALRLCERIIAKQPDERASAMKARLDTASLAATHPPMIPEIVLDFDLDSPPPRKTPARPVYQSNEVYWWIAGVVALSVVVLLTVSYGQAVTERWLQAAHQKQPVMALDVIMGIVGRVLLGLYMGFPAGYLALRVTGYLQNDFVEDVKVVSVTVILCYLMMMTCVGVFAVPFYLKKRFEMGLGELAIAIVCYLVCQTVLSAVFMEVTSLLGSALFFSA
jgi:tetratricopeptide (TPR) repeat protein